MKWLSALILTFTFTMAYGNEPWRTPSQSELVYLEVEGGQIVIQLAPFIAPQHAARFKALVEEGFYNGLDFYRVIDGFVAQAGDISEKKPSKNKAVLKAEVSRNLMPDSNFVLVQKPALLASETGFIDEFPAGRDTKDQQEWLLHCPGTVAMARSNELHSGSTEFYITIGQAPRHLDRNMSTFGRVIWGMEYAQALKRAPADNASGVIQNPAQRSKIIAAHVGTDLPKEQQLTFEIQRATSAKFQQRLKDARTLSAPFYHHKGNGNLDVCYYRPKIRLKS